MARANPRELTMKERRRLSSDARLVPMFDVDAEAESHRLKSAIDQIRKILESKQSGMHLSAARLVRQHLQPKLQRIYRQHPDPDDRHDRQCALNELLRTEIPWLSDAARRRVLREPRRRDRPDELMTAILLALYPRLGARAINLATRTVLKPSSK